jgi:hypothetical protein
VPEAAAVEDDMEKLKEQTLKMANDAGQLRCVETGTSQDTLYL